MSIIGFYDVCVVSSEIGWFRGRLCRIVVVTGMVLVFIVKVC